MNRSLVTIVVGVLGLLTAFVVIVQVTSGQGNSLATTAKFLAVASFIFGVLKPKGGLVWIIVLCGYSDMLKRLMVFDSAFTFIDIGFVLGMAPACLAGITLGCLGQGGIRANLQKSDLVVFALCTLYFLGVIFRALQGGAGMLGAGKAALLEGAFVYAAFAAKVLLRDREEMIRYLRIAIWLFVPVAIYGIYQGIAGLTAFEREYLETGYSIEARQLFDVRARAFSTLNAASTLTVICALFALFVLTQSYGAAGSVAKVLHPINLLLVTLYLTAMILTYTRAGWLAFLVGAVALICFRYKFTILLFYGAGLVTFLVLFFSADYALQNLEAWQHALTGGEWSQALRITTWSDRLIGWRNLSQDLDLWRPFGFDSEEIVHQNEVAERNSPFFYHDAFTRFVLHRGFIPLIVVIVMATIALTKAHGRVLALPLQERRFAVCLLACVASVASVGVTHSTILQFPVNFFFWIVVGSLVRLLWQREAVAAQAPAPSTTEFEPGGTPAWSYYNYS